MPYQAGRPTLPQSALTIGLIALLAFVVEILLEHLIRKPLEQAAPHAPRWWLIYVSLVLGAALGWFSEVNLFEGLIPVLVGRIVTALLYITPGRQQPGKWLDQRRRAQQSTCIPSRRFETRLHWLLIQRAE